MPHHADSPADTTARADAEVDSATTCARVAASAPATTIHDASDIHPVVRHLAQCALRTRALFHDAPAPRIGDITLLPHQATAVRWLLPRMERYGGALLADPPGLGKTYVALAVAAELECRPLVIAPAVLRALWTDAARAASTPIDFVSTERLSAPAAPRLAAHGLVIIDEAHHLRTPSTRRHRRTTHLCTGAKVLLLSATPIHNSTDDLGHLTNLFHRPATHPSTAALRQRLTLRRTVADIHAARLGNTTALTIPLVRHRNPITLATRTTTLPADILAIPPIRSDAHDSHTLLQLGLLHALRSSEAAARARIHHRIASTLAIEHAARAHVHPTTEIRRAWRSHGPDIQLAMPELLGRPSDSLSPHLADDASMQRSALESLLRALSGDADRTRSTVLRRLARWSTRPIVAFTQFSATAEQFFHELRHQPGIALLNGSDARLVSGTLSRADVLQRLLDPRHRHRHDRVRLLITTDVLSEGLSLSGVATIVHLDLPWTAARLDQRIGRAARIGAPVTEVHDVSLPAPLPIDAYSAITSILARKRHAMRAMDPADDAGSRIITLLVALAQRRSALRTTPSGWVTMHSHDLAHARSLALVRVHGRNMLVASDERGLRAPVESDWQALAAASETTHVPGRVAALRQRLRAWQAECELRDSVSDLHDHRLRSRQAADDALHAVDRSARGGHSLEATVLRRQILRPTHIDATRIAGAHRGPRVSVRSGVALLPVQAH